MKQKFIIIITLLLALACAAVPAVADTSSDVPLLPMHLFGTAYYENGDAVPVPAGTSIVATLGTKTFTYTLIEDGVIGSDNAWDELFIVSGDVAGESITFSLVDTRTGDTLSAAETVIYEPGEISEIFLTFEGIDDDITETDYGTVFVYQNNTGLPDGMWTYGTTPIIVENGVIYPNENFVAGTYRLGSDYVQVTYPTASYHVNVSVNGISTSIETGESVSQGSEIFLDVISVSSTVPVTNLVIDYPNGTGIKIDSSSYEIPALSELGTYRVHALFDSSYFVPGTPVDCLFDQNYFSFTVIDEMGHLEIQAPKGLSLDAGDVWVYANYYNSTGYWQDDTYVTWKIDDKSIIGLAEMEDRSVRLSPRSTGTAILYAELSDNPLINATVEIPVEKTEVIRITGGHSSTTLSLGTTGSAWANAVDQFDKSFSYKEVEWSVKNGNVSLTSSDDDVYKVIISPISVGTDTITARSISNPELSWSFDVKVIAGTTNPNAGDPDYVSLKYYENTYLTVDSKPVSVSAYVYDEHGNTLHEEEIIWEVENESVAVVSVDHDINDPTHQATLTPKSKGTTILYAYSADKKLNDSIVIHVDDTIITSVDGPDFPKKTGVSSSTWGPHVYVYDQFGNQLPDEYVTITVSDGSVLTLRSADATGSSIRIQNDNYVFWEGLSPGTVTVTTTSVSNTSISETRTVTVEEQRVALISLQNYADTVLTTSSSKYISAKLEDQFGDTIYGNHDLVWTVENESVLTVSTNNYGSTKLTPVAPGTTAIRVALKSDRTLYDEVSITVEETILSSIYLSGTTEMSLFSNGQAKAYVLDQVGNEIDSEKIGWKVDNPAILEIEPIWVNGNYDHYISINPKAVGSTKIHAYSVSKPSVTWNMTVTVLEPVLTEIELPYTAKTIAMNTLGTISADVWDQFGDYPEYAEISWSVDNPDILELSSALSKNGREILLIPQAPGIVNLTVSPVGFPEYSETVQIKVTGSAPPAITTKLPVTAYNGETLEIIGTADSGSVIQAIIIGDDTIRKHTAVADANGEFAVIIPTADLSTGSYSLILQSPMYDGNFNIDIASDGKVYQNTTGPAVVDGVGCGTVLFNTDDRKPENAAQAFYDAVFASGVDWCEIGEIWVYDSALRVNPISNTVVGAPLEVSGTSSYPAGTEIFVELLDWSDEQVQNKTAVVSASGTWNATFNTSGLEANWYYDVHAEIPGVSSWRSSVYLYEGIQLYLYGPSYVELGSVGKSLSIGYYSNIPVSDDGLDCIWNVSNESVLTIGDADSWSWKEIRPIAEGTTTVRVSLADDPSVFSEIEVTVVSELIPSYMELWLYDDTISTAASGEFEINVYDQFGQSIYSKNGESLSHLITVTSDNTSVVTVVPSSDSGDYILIPVSPGSAEICAVLNADSNISASATVTVVESEMGIYLWAESETISVGTEGYIQAYVYDQFEHPAAMYTDEFTWSVSNPDVLQLEADYNGYYGVNYRMKMTALAPGTATVTAVWKENPFYVAEYTVTVEKPTHSYIGIWGTNDLTLDTVIGENKIGGVLYDQYGNTILTDPVSATVVNKSVISLSKDPEDAALWIIHPIAVGTTDVVLSVKDSSVEPEIISITVEETKPRLHVSTLGYTYSTEVSLSHADMITLGAVDQFGNFIDPVKYPVSWSVSNATVLNVTAVDNTGESTRLVYTPKTTGTAILNFSLENGESEAVEFTISEDTEITAIGITNIIAYEAEETQTASMKTSAQDIPYPPYPDYADAERLTLGTEYMAEILVGDQFGNVFGTDAITITADTPGIISWEWQKELASYGLSGWILNITPLKAGTVTLTAASADNPSVSDSITLKVVGPTLVVPSGQAEVIVPLTISPKGSVLYKDTEVSITTETDGASIYYTLDGTTPTNQSILYEKPFVLDESVFDNGKSLVIKAVAVKDGCADSTVVTEIYSHAKKDKPKHKVHAASVTGGSVTLSTTESEADELISLTFTTDEGYQLAGWSIIGNVSGDCSNKSGEISEFAMWDEDVIIIIEYIQIADAIPKPASIKLQHVPSKIYENDTGALNAIVYDQFGNRFADNKVTWNSSAPSVFAVNTDTGVYQARAGGIAVVTATSIDDPTISASVTLSVYVPPKPLITGKVSGPTTAYYGVMSDPYIVTSEYSSHLNWDFGDGTPTVKTEVNYPYPHWTSSYDTVSHTFVETGDLTVELTPSNSYREGETKTFTVHVTYAPPRNLVITDGPTAVVGGESAVYTAFATNADTYVWYLDGHVVEGQTGSVATILFPASESERTAEVKVAASYKDSGYCEPVTKTVTVSVAGGELGEFGKDITMNPAKPAVGDIVVFSIDKVSNAVKYRWTFEDGYTKTTTAPKVSHALKDTETDSVTVTAYNSADLTKEKTYTFTAAGAKPAKPVITASKTPANPGDTITFTAESDGAKTYQWVIDGSVQESTTNTCEVFWTVDDIGKHEIAVTVSNDYGAEKSSIGYEVIAKKGKPAVIKEIQGNTIVNQKSTAVFHAKISCQDDYTIAWYLNNELLKGETEKKIKLVDLAVGEYVLKVIVTTEYEEVSELSTSFTVVSHGNTSANKKDKSLAEPENAVTPQLVDNSTSGKSAFSTVGSLTLDKDDISQDADEVSIEIAPINPEELTGFTDEMGSRQSVLMSLEINPTGLKNEKDLSKSAHITFRLLKDDVADPEAIQFYRLDTGSGIDQWVRLHKVSCVEDGDYYEFTVATAGMSQFVAAPVYLSAEEDKPAVPTVEVTNTTATFNAVTAAEVSYTVAPENIGTLRAPVLTKGGLTLTISNVIVEKVIGGTSTKVSAEVLANGAVSVTGDISDAESLKVSFMGRMLGDVTSEGAVDTLDAARVLQASVGLYSFSDADTFYGDVSGDGFANTLDAARILQYSVNLVDENYVTKT